MRAFKSDWRRQIRDVITAPHRLMLEIREVLIFIFTFIREVIRSSPNPPSFSRMAARIIDPATGASTWAFGSHK